jgi:hypothetical protein
MIGALLAIGAVMAIADHVRRANEGLIRWTPTLAIIAYAVTAVGNASTSFEFPAWLHAMFREIHRLGQRLKRLKQGGSYPLTRVCLCKASYLVYGSFQLIFSLFAAARRLDHWRG